MSRLISWVGALALSVWAAPSGVVDRSYVVTCRVPGDPAARVFSLEQADGEWRLAFSSTRTGGSKVRLALPRARPVISETAAHLTYRNANGGRRVDLSVEQGTASLEVWVDHGLEVNIEPDLDPRVDLMNTDGPLAGVQCAIEPASTESR